MKCALLLLRALALLLVTAGAASAQGNCQYIATGAVLTPAQWNLCFAAKQNNLGYTPVNKAGDTMLGKLTTLPTAVSGAGLNLPAGTAPSAPTNGDLWTTTSGLYVRINGSTVGPLVSSATVALTGNATPITGTCMSGGILFNNAGTLSCTDTSGAASLTTSNTLSILLPSATVAQALVIGTQSGSSFTPTAGPYNAIEINSTWTTSLSGGGSPGGPETMHTMHINLYVGGAAYGAQTVAAFSGVLHHVLDIPAGGHSAGGDLTAIGGFVNSTAAAPGRHMYSITGGVRCDTGCTSLAILGQENDMFLEGAGSTNYVIGQNMWIGSTANPVRWSAGYTLGASGSIGAFGWDYYGVLFTEGGAAGLPLKTTGSMFYADGPMTFANVFSMTSATITGSILLFPNVDITGAGVGRFGSATSAGGLEIAGGALDNTSLTYAFNGVEKFSIGSTATVAYWTKVGAVSSAISIDFTTNQPTLNNGVTIATAFDAPGLVKNADLVTGTFSNITGTGTLTAGATGAGFTVNLGSSTISGRLAFANLTQGAALSVLANATNGTADFAALAAASDSQVLRRSGTALAFGAIDLSASGAVGTSRLAYANLAQGSARSVLGVTGNATADNASLQSSAAGQILNSTATTIAWTATPVLGVAGTTVGTLGFQNATSGNVTVSPPTGALGTVTVFLPAANDTLVGKATTDTLTNKTLTSPTINGGTLSAITSFALRDTSAAFDVTIAATSSTALTAGRILTLDLVNAARTLKLGANLTIASDPGAVSGAMKSNGTGTFAQAACADLSNSTALCTTAPATGIATFLATPTSANLAAAITDETGTAGALVFSGSPAFTGTVSTSSTPIYQLVGASRTYNLDISSTTFRVVDVTGGASVFQLTLGVPAFPLIPNIATTSAVCVNTSTGALSYNGTVGTCTVSLLAAKNLKARLTDKEGFDIVESMEPWRYDMKEGLPTYVAGEQIGFVAEYTRDERIVAHNADGSAAGIRYEQYTAALTAAFKYLKADNDNLRLEVETLKAARR